MSADDAIDRAIAQAAAEQGLASYYCALVRPLLRDREHWPRCCGGGCEPCADQLIAVAERALALLDGKP